MSDLDFALCAEPGCLRVAKPDAGYCARHSAPVGGSAKRQDRVDGLDPKDEHAVGEAEAPTLNPVSDTARDALTKAVTAVDLEREAWKTLVEAASQSNWIPPEYFMNDWISDCADFLRNGPLTTLKTYEQGVEDATRKAANIVRNKRRRHATLYGSRSGCDVCEALADAEHSIRTQTSPDHVRRGI